MESKNEATPAEQPRPNEPPAPKKRFQMVKLEERIAPKKGGSSNGGGSLETSQSGGGMGIY